MKRLLFTLVILVSWNPYSRLAAQTTETLSVGASPTPIYASINGYFGVLYENSTNPAATFVVTPSQANGTQVLPTTVSIGAAYVFSRSTGFPFNPGELLGYVQATAAGPFNFILVQYANAPNAPQVSAVRCPTGLAVSQINPDGTTQCGGGLGPLAQWDPVLNATVFTAPGTWSAPVWFTNSNSYAQQTHAGTEFLENTDGQFEIVTLENSYIKALLNLDTDGNIALYGANGGGIATDASGRTCLAGNNGSCWNVAFAVDGPLVNYQGVATKGGDGMPVILYGGTSPQVGNFGPFTMYTTPASGYTSNGLFRFSGYVVATSPATGATAQVRIDYVDASGANHQDTGPAVPLGTVGAMIPFSFILQSAPSSAINISVLTTNTPVYNISGTIEAL
ncbi:MAG TPA: hypothetical protein VJX70_08960 [Candidatus Acidoferrum sp.]|nr:hypothetical protein [Candidatus Acidoferrum sp.]